MIKKTLKFILLVLVTAGLTISSNAQPQDQSKVNQASTKTETFKVLGNCGMCKNRIEKTVKTEGVQTAAWDSKTKLLTVTYDPSKTNKDVLSKKLAAMGHDTEKYKAPDNVYEKLPGCCHYERAN